MALTLPFNVRDFFLNKGKTIVCSNDSGSPTYTLTNASVYTLRLSNLELAQGSYIRGDKRVVVAKTDCDTAGYTPHDGDLVIYSGSTYRIMDVSDQENFDQYKWTMRRC